MNAALVDEAKELDINLSREFEEHLAALVRERRAAKWRAENKKAIEAYGKYFERNGIWNEDDRGW
ncbi:MAG: type II toxin-antitoxin system CcdA family antitoxin [Myxococcaceae bacterium]|nr:type II toxin-antitoxin system CcdA family antitoxin [Myxococcaceae bacterium]